MQVVKHERTAPVQDAQVAVHSIDFLSGPNIYAYIPVMVAEVSIGAYDELGSDAIDGFRERLVSWLPGLWDHECSPGRRGGFIERLERGTYLAHIWEHVTLELQTLMGFHVRYGRTRGTGRLGEYRMVIAYEAEEPARAAFDVALRLILAAIHDEPFDLPAALDALRATADRHRLGPSTAAILRAARRRDVPVIRLTKDQSLFQLGWGVHQQRIQAAVTSRTSIIAADICQDKQVAKQLLESAGLPVPQGQVVASADEAWEVAQELGLPVVVKPLDMNQGKGVSVDLSTKEAVHCAYATAGHSSPRVLVERHIVGHDYRLLVINGRMVAAARRDPPFVVGDGKRSIRQLVEAMNLDPRRHHDHSGPLTLVKLDEVVQLALEQQGLSTDTVPEVGQKVTLRRNANLSTGGTSTDVTDRVAPENAQLAELAAAVIGLDIAGIDMLCLDISKPLQEQNGAIIEVNASPGLRMHLQPYHGRPRDVGTPIVEMLFPHGTSRIPLTAITGTNGKTTVTRLISHIYETAHHVVGMTSTNGVYIDGRRVVAGDCAGPGSARMVLRDPRVEAAVLETARGGIISRGLAFDCCAVGVVTNVKRDHLGLAGIHTQEQLAQVKQVVVEAVRPDGAAVLNAEDPLVAQMAAACQGRVVFFGRSRSNPVIKQHLTRSGVCAFVDDGAIVLAQGEDRTPVMRLADIPFTYGGKIQFMVDNALAAVAAAWAQGLDLQTIRSALSTFQANEETLPGRFNIREIDGVQVILDYGHNEAALTALGQAVVALGERPTTMILGLPGDRRNEDLAAAIDATSAYVHKYLVIDQVDRRGRAEGEIYRLVCDALGTNVPCRFAGTESQAIPQAMRQAKPGDRLIIIADEVDTALELLTRLRRRQHAGSRSGKRLSTMVDA